MVPFCTSGRSRPFHRSTWLSSPKFAMGSAGLGVQRDQLIAGRDEQDAVVALAVAPIADAAIVGAHGAALGGIVAAIGPQGFAGGGVGGDHGAPGAGGEEELARRPSAESLPRRPAERGPCSGLSSARPLADS